MYLTFTPYAYAKLAYLRDKGDTEVGGFGIGDPNQPLLITDFFMVDQECTSVFCELDGADSNRLMAELHAERGLTPDQTARVWIHTHPGNSATPSSVDETTFEDTWGEAPWSVMAILAKGGATYARLQYRTRPPASFLDDLARQTTELTWQIDYSVPFNGSDHAAWDDEYAKHLTRKTYAATKPLYGVPAKYDYDSARYWERPSTSKYNGYGRLFDSDGYTLDTESSDFQTSYQDDIPDPEWLECSDCDHVWPYNDHMNAADLLRCPVCDSSKIDFRHTPPKPRRKKRGKRNDI